MRTRILSAHIFATVLTLTMAVGIAAGSPPTGYRNIQDFARAGFGQVLDECLDANASVIFTAGDNLQEIGDGKPGSWSDVHVDLKLTDPCTGAQILHLSGFTPVEDPDITRLETATVEDVVVHLVDSTGTFSVDALVNLTWTGNDDAVVRIDHELDRRYFRQERYETAEVKGTVTFSDSDAWPGGIEFTASDANDVAIGTANEISLQFCDTCLPSA